MRITNYQRGDTLVEVTIGLAILSLVLAASFALIRKAISVNQSAKERIQAANIMQEQIEALRNFRDSPGRDWVSFKNAVNIYPFDIGMFINTGVWDIQSCSTPCTSGIYSYNISKSEISSDKYQFTINISWPRPGGGTDQASLSTYLVNLDGLKQP